MQTILLILQVFSCFFLIGFILLQKGQGSEMGAAFGGASQTVFGSRGPATFLNKITVVIAVIFLGASLALANIAKQKSTASVVDVEKKELTREEGVVEPKAPAEKIHPLPVDEGGLPSQEKE